ncbi:hypothetical protein F66182_18135, partial [Fusarium sp. NRRL 66182]
DVAFARIIKQYLPAEVKSRVDGEMSELAQFAISKEAMDWVADTERSPPQVQHWDSWGEKKDELIHFLYCAELAKLIWQNRLAALPSLTNDYEGYARIIQVLKLHLFSPASATSNFHLILSDGVGTLLLAHLKDNKLDDATRALFQHAYDRLSSADPDKGWTSGLWMTERAGGSDLTPTETTATYSPLGPGDEAKDADGFPLGPWVLNGLKWFSTSTEGSMAVAVARTDKGLS